MNRPGLTRRDVLRLAGAGGAAIFVGCGDNDGPREAGFEHASAVIEPEASSFIVVVWSSLARTAALEVRSGDAVVHSAVVELALESGTGALEVRGLEPARSYQVTLVCDNGTRLGPHQVRTAPHAGDPRPVRIAVSADIDPHPDFESAVFEAAAAASPELFVSLGDFPYADNGPGPAMTVPQYRERYVQALTTPKVRRWLESVGVRPMYDDHEFRNDWDAMYRTVEASRYAAAMQVWDEFFPLRGAAGDVRYRSWRWGAHLECFLLDVRRFRSANAAFDDGGKTMLGETQRAWLLDGIERSTATFKVVFTPVPLGYGDGNDHWSSFTNERARIFAALVGVPGILFVSADQHVFAAHRHAHGIREFQVGPMARGLGAPKLEDSGVLFRSAQYNFGLIDADAARLTFSGVGADGTVFYKEELTAQDLTPAP